MAEIYGLYSGRDGVVRYVGETGWDRASRFKQHMRDAEWLRSHRQLGKWLHREWLAGYPVESALLECCKYDVRDYRETEWIDKFPSRDLFNERKVNRWGRFCKPPRIQEIIDYRRRYLCNVGGFRGIRYDRHWDRFQVLIYNGRGVEWLFGDQCDEGMPGWGGNMYFHDRTAALIARDNARKWMRSLRWLPDIEPEECFVTSLSKETSTIAL